MNQTQDNEELQTVVSNVDLIVLNSNRDFYRVAFKKIKYTP